MHTRLSSYVLTYSELLRKMLHIEQWFYARQEYRAVPELHPVQQYRQLRYQVQGK